MGRTVGLALRETGAMDRSNQNRGVAIWSTPEWRASAVEWLDSRLAEARIRRTGEVEQPRIRAWATVLRVPSDAGLLWLKASSYETGFEPALYELLVETATDQVLHPIASDTARDWVLLPDGGPSLGRTLGDGDPCPVLESVLPAYGRLQLALAGRVDDLLDLGLDDMRPERAGERFDEAAAAVGRAVTQEDVAAYDRTLAMRPRFLEWAAELALSPVPPSLDHNDLHSDNVLVPAGQPGAAPRFYDWGDSVVAHPFATMLHGLGWVAAHLGTDQDDARILRLRDAYLGAFADYGTPRELARTLELACRVAMVARTLTWARAIAMGDAATGFERAPLTHFLAIPGKSYLSTT